MHRSTNRGDFFAAAILLIAALFLTTGATAIHPEKAAPNATLAGKLLVAAPEMGDPRFVETVIYIVKDDREGTLGLVVNRPLAKGDRKSVV